jgi:hypothetical protein
MLAFDNLSRERLGMPGLPLVSSERTPLLQALSGLVAW